MDYEERGSHARGMYPTQYTSHMVPESAKQREETDARVITRK